MHIRGGGLAIIVFALAPFAYPQGGVVGRKSADGKIHFASVEDFQINGSRKIRLMPAGTRSIAPEEIKRYLKAELSQVGIIRSEASHWLVVLDASGKPGPVVLPDSVAVKAPMDADSVAGKLGLQVYPSKKTKTPDALPQEEFFVFLPGLEGDRLTLKFVMGNAGFTDLEEQLAAMQGFVDSFPASEVKADLRELLQTRLTNGLAAFESGGAYKDLLTTRKFAALTTTAFAGDAGLAKLRQAVEDKIDFIDTTRLVLMSLAASGDWDVFLARYPSFEPYHSSFPEIRVLRETALEESAHGHARRGRLLSERQQHPAAIEEFAAASRRDPDNRQTANLLEGEKVAESKIEARASVVSRRVLPPDSEEDRLFKRSLYNAERAIQDKEYSKAQASIQEAETANKGAPQILVVQALLLKALNRHAEALPILDNYDRLVVDPAERTRGSAVRDEILYELNTKKTVLKQQLAEQAQAGQYSRLRATAADALRLDANDDEFLYYSGIAAAVFRDNPGATKLLDQYLAQSNSLRGDLKERDRAFRVRALLQTRARTAPSGVVNWFSGRSYPGDLFYCPESGAFQLPIGSISGYKVEMTFQWDRDRLLSITSAFDDEKGIKNYRTMGSSVESPGNFYFQYIASVPGVQAVSAVKTSQLSAFPDLRVARDGNGQHLLDAQGAPRMVLTDHSQFNAEVLSFLEGSLTTGIAGNAFFNPFVWDGIHYFSLTYDNMGRLASAREWNADNLIRFTWSGQRLTEIRAFHKDSDKPYYQRAIAYSPQGISGETYSAGVSSGKIKYIYSAKGLDQIRVEDNGVHDGKTWTVHLRRP